VFDCFIRYTEAEARIQLSEMRHRLGRDHIALVDAKTEHRGKGEPPNGCCRYDNKRDPRGTDGIHLRFLSTARPGGTRGP
jgi:hypothetical protein